jgi:hypothetical protein
MVRGAAEAGRTDIRIWGNDLPDDFDGAGLDAHRLSGADRALNAQALAADSTDLRSVGTEEFRRRAAPAGRRLTGTASATLPAREHGKAARFTGGGMSRSRYGGCAGGGPLEWQGRAVTWGGMSRSRSAGRTCRGPRRPCPRRQPPTR